MKYLEIILNKIKQLSLKRNKLEDDYVKNGKIKGRAYQKKMSYINEQIKAQIERLKNLGTDGYAYKVKLGKLEIYQNKPETKYTYFININEDTINRVCEYRFPGWSVLEKTKIPLGNLMDN